MATINSVLDDTVKSSEVYEKLYQQVRRTGAGLDETAKAFTKYQLALEKQGKSTDDTIDLVTGLQAAMVQMGLTTSEVNSITTQLGQGLASTILSGEEWKAIRENMPALADHLRKELGKTDAEMKKFVDDQKLTTDIVIEPLLAFARTWREKLANAPLRMGLEWNNLGTTFARLIADLDQAFKLSERLARGLRAVSDMLERWRKNISTLKQFVDGLGDMRSAIVAVVAMMFIWLTATGALNAAMLMLGRAIVFAFLPLAGIVAWFLIIEDFVSWIMGKRSLFGEKFGEVDAVTAKIKAAVRGDQASLPRHLRGRRGHHFGVGCLPRHEAGRNRSQVPVDHRPSTAAAGRRLVQVAFRYRQQGRRNLPEDGQGVPGRHPGSLASAGSHRQRHPGGVRRLGSDHQRRHHWLRSDSEEH